MGCRATWRSARRGQHSDADRCPRRARPQPHASPSKVLRREAHRHLVSRRGLKRLKQTCAVSMAPLASTRWSAPARERLPRERILPCSWSFLSAGTTWSSTSETPMWRSLLTRAIGLAGEEVEPAPAEQRKAVLDRARERARHIRQSAVLSRHLVAHDYRAAAARADHAQVLLRSPLAVGRRGVEVVDASSTARAIARSRSAPARRATINRRHPHTQKPARKTLSPVLPSVRYSMRLAMAATLHQSRGIGSQPAQWTRSGNLPRKADSFKPMVRGSHEEANQLFGLAQHRIVPGVHLRVGGPSGARPCGAGVIREGCAPACSGSLTPSTGGPEVRWLHGRFERGDRWGV